MEREEGGGSGGHRPRRRSEIGDRAEVAAKKKGDGGGSRGKVRCGRAGRPWSRRSARAAERGGHGEGDVRRRTGDGGQPWEGEMRPSGGGGVSTGARGREGNFGWGEEGI